MLSKPLVKYVLTAASRDKLMITLLLMIALGAAVSILLGGAATSEEAAFSSVFASGGLRFLGVLGIVMFCAFYMRRAFDHKEVEFLLSRPISRMTFLSSHAIAFIFLAILIAALVTLAVALVGKPHMGGLLAWGLSLMTEYGIMAVTAMFFSMVLSSAAGSALAALGVYVLARMMGTLLGIASAPPENILFALMNNVMELISTVIPRLDLMGQTSWLVYGVEGAGGLALTKEAGRAAHFIVEQVGVVGFIGLQGVVFILLLLAATAFDFARKEF